MTDSLETALVLGRPLRYRIRRHRRARQVGVTVCRRDGVVVTLPWFVGRHIIPELLSEWAGWLDEQVDKHGVRLGPRVRQYATGSEILILGHLRRLRITALPAERKRAVCRLEEDILNLELPAAEVLSPRPALERFLRRLARQELRGRIDRWAEVVGRRPQRLIVGERTSRWGSCSGKGALSFCYRLVMAPVDVLDAVVAHELCHLVHLNHGPRFHSLLDRVCPGHADAMRWLHEHEEKLHF